MEIKIDYWSMVEHMSMHIGKGYLTIENIIKSIANIGSDNSDNIIKTHREQQQAIREANQREQTESSTSR